MPTLYGLLGPTASYKTEVALLICDKLNAEIVSCDSVLIYRMMDIGSNKPCGSDLSKHQLVNIINPWDHYSAFHYITDAHRVIADIHRRGKNALFVGGTMLYFKLLTHGMEHNYCQIISDQIDLVSSRVELVDLICRHAPNDQQVDLHALNLYKLKRMAKIILSNSSCTSKIINKLEPLDITTCAFYTEDRSHLYKNVEHRAILMIKNGLLNELEFLYNHRLITRDLTSMQHIAYKHGWDYFYGNATYETFFNKVVIASRHTVKKQLTWIRNWGKDIYLINNELSILEKADRCFNYLHSV